MCSFFDLDGGQEADYILDQCMECVYVNKMNVVANVQVEIKALGCVSDMPADL